jgi:hypothetical protein
MTITNMDKKNSRNSSEINIVARIKFSGNLKIQFIIRIFLVQNDIRHFKKYT